MVVANFEPNVSPIVVLSSAGATRPRRSNVVYGASKAGLDTFCLALGDRLVGSGVGIMIVRVHRKTKSLRLGGLVPKQPLERLLWLVWVPLVASWLVLPYLALGRHGAWIRTPGWAIEDPPYAALRWVAAGMAVACLLLTAWCWARMDVNWSMAVSDEHKGELIVDEVKRPTRIDLGLDQDR